jgi:hypothetical protein
MGIVFYALSLLALVAATGTLLALPPLHLHLPADALC